MNRWVLVAVLLCAPLVAFADDPPPAPSAEFVAPKEVTGTGTREDPFEFTSATKCVLRLANVAEGTKFSWDLRDAPKDIEPIGNALVFSQSENGDFQAIAHTGVYARCWFRIKSGADPPIPAPISTLASRVKAAIVGPDAKADATKLSAICDQIVEELNGTNLQETADLFDTWEAAFSGDNKLKGAYPKLAVIMREMLPPQGSDSVPITASDRTRFIELFQIIATASKGISNGS